VCSLRLASYFQLKPCLLSLCHSLVDKPWLDMRIRSRPLHNLRSPQCIIRIEVRPNSGDEEVTVTLNAQIRSLTLGDIWVVHLPHASPAALGAVDVFVRPRFGRTEEIELDTCIGHRCTVLRKQVVKSTNYKNFFAHLDGGNSPSQSARVEWYSRCD
jgi:hypothetical protein